MLYLCFRDSSSLDLFKKEALARVNCENYRMICKEACEEDYKEICVLKNSLDIPFIYMEWNNDCISLIPCVAYKGLGFYNLSDIDNMLNNILKYENGSTNAIIKRLICSLVSKFEINLILFGANVFEPSKKEFIVLSDEYDILTSTKLIYITSPQSLLMTLHKSSYAMNLFRTIINRKLAVIGLPIDVRDITQLDVNEIVNVLREFNCRENVCREGDMLIMLR